MTVENKQERWVKFRRIHCKEGYIDVWNGDSADHPDNPEKSRIHLNSTAQMYRTNGSVWTDYRDLPGILGLLTMGEVFSATEIWNECLRIDENRRR